MPHSKNVVGSGNPTETKPNSLQILGIMQYQSITVHFHTSSNRNQLTTCI